MTIPPCSYGYAVDSACTARSFSKAVIDCICLSVCHVTLYEYPDRKNKLPARRARASLLFPNH